MDQNPIRTSSGAATDEPAFASTLVSDALNAPFLPRSTEARAVRHDGWTSGRQRAFLAALAQCGVVADAARAVGMSVQSAYALRGRAAGRAFHLGWEAALIHGRRRLADEVMSRAINGCIEAVHRDGCIVAERHRYDNRLSMAVLTRLDHQTEDNRQEGSAVRIVADEFEQYLDVIEAGGEGARAFLSARAPAEAAGKPSREEELLARLETYRKFRVGLAHEIDTSDLDPATMAGWTEEQIERADLSGFLARLAENQWPEAVRAVSPASAEQPLVGEGEGPHGILQLHQLYLRHCPPQPAETPSEFTGLEVWEDDDGTWWTDFPPPEGFAGDEDGDYGDDDYRRTLTEAEQALIDEDVALDLAEDRAEAEAARDRYFGFESANEPAAETPEDPSEPLHTRHRHAELVSASNGEPRGGSGPDPKQVQGDGEGASHIAMPPPLSSCRT